jgi:3-deoxy-D-arabino-heptulosonate 7-phosphate (DAHP) synthase
MSTNQALPHRRKRVKPVIRAAVVVGADAVVVAVVTDVSLP